MLLFLVSVALFSCYIAQSEHIFGSFKVKPSEKTLYYQKRWQKYNCTFTYRVQGETQEQWQFIFENVQDGKKLRCTVSRGTTSYLLFDNFTMSITGPKVYIEDYDATSYLEQRLKPEEVKLNTKKRMVHAVEGTFQKKLERVTVMARIGKKNKYEL